jgi:hypothetical protein
MKAVIDALNVAYEEKEELLRSPHILTRVVAGGLAVLAFRPTLIPAAPFRDL